ncbi:MAG: hypothetical protein H6Q20_987 [Bacteroidetes bacterium]|nr:hypothetical protein [Bacteroidota bacterium]
MKSKKRNGFFVYYQLWQLRYRGATPVVNFKKKDQTR